MQLYIGNLSEDMTKIDVKEFISTIYLTQLVTIIRDIESGKSRSFA